MLNNTENKMMSVLYNQCKSKGTTLISIEELFKYLPKDKHISLSDVEKTLKNLAYDGYIDIIATDKKGKFFYLVTLKEKGEAYPRERVSQRREIKRRLILTVVFALLSFVIGIFLKSIFS